MLHRISYIMVLWDLLVTWVGILPPIFSAHFLNGSQMVVELSQGSFRVITQRNGFGLGSCPVCLLGESHVLLAGSAVGRRRSGRHLPGGAFGWAVQSSFLMQWPRCTCNVLVLGGTHAC
ncbi:hypothetical protein U1Q18_008983 [Sarracenia purpurea var. burkii]